MNKPDTPPELPSKAAPSYKKQALGVILTLGFVLVIASVFEAWPYFSPVTLSGKAKPNSLQYLPDGTGVVLESGARLKLGREWKTGGYREVWLLGGAQFTVPTMEDTSELTIHLEQFDVVAQKAILYCSGGQERGTAWLKEGKAAIITRDPKPKKILFKPGTLVESAARRLLTRSVPSDTSLAHFE